MKQMLYDTQQRMLSYPPESSTLASELAGFRINVIAVFVLGDFEDLITGRRRLLATTIIPQTHTR